jgi:hypothetical protein
MNAEPMSLRAYARHRGVSLRAVQKAIASGRIAARADGRLDAATADANWARNTAPRPIPAAKPVKRPVIVPTPEGAHHHAEPRPAARESVEPPKLGCRAFAAMNFRC